MKRRLITLFVGLAIILLGSFYIIFKSNYWPVVVVNWNPIFQKNINNYYKMSLNYYEKALLTAGSDPKILQDQLTLQEIKRATIEKLITDKIIYAKAKKIIGKDLETIADQKITNVLKTTDINEAVGTILGNSLADFTEIELKPQAYEEILRGRMDLSGENFTDWLKKAKTDARIIFLISGYSWDGKNVKIAQ